MTGKKISHYRILEKLGEGGMGVVYKAKDLNLKRIVALKFLNPDSVKDKVKKASLLQEAQAAATISHPNISTIYEINKTISDSGKSGDELLFIAMEYIEGQNLKERIQSGPIDMNKAINIAIQIAEGLQEIHDKSMVHRDIKSDNIRITEKGQVKIMDFGLVKSSLVKEKISHKGSTYGTLAYMSPEQIRGKNTDHRSDIWSWGIILYEMIAGHLPFKTDKDGMTYIYSILDEEPESIRKTCPDISPDCLQLLGHALEKDPGYRYQSMEDVLIDLKSMKMCREKAGELAEEEHTIPRSGSVYSRFKIWRTVLFAAAILLVVAIMVIILLINKKHQVTAEPKVTVLTSYNGLEYNQAFSPDGNKLAFTWTKSHEDNWDIYIKGVGEEDYYPLTSSKENEYDATWSENGNTIAYIRQGEERSGIYTKSILGGSETKIHTFNKAVFQGGDIWPGIDWSWDGKWLVFIDLDSIENKHCLFRLDLKTRGIEQLTSPPSDCLGDMNPNYSPDGKSVAFERLHAYGNGDLHIVEIVSKKVDQLTFDGIKIYDLAWMPNGREIVFSSYRDGNTKLWRIAANGGKPVPLKLVGVSNGAGGISISRSGERLAYTVVVHNHDIWQADLPTSRTGKIEPYEFITSSKNDIFGNFSPNGEKISFGSSRSGLYEIWICNSDASDQMRLSSLKLPANLSQWSPDGNWIVFDANPHNQRDIFVADANGSKPPVNLTNDPYDDRHPTWAQDGQWIYYGSDRSGDDQIYKINIQTREVIQVTSEGGFFGFESPDSKWLYYKKSREREERIYRLNLENVEVSIAVNEPVHTHRWIAARKGIYYIVTQNGDHILKLYRYSTETVEYVGIIEQNFYLSDISDDGQKMLLWNLYSTSDIYLAENFK